VYHNDLAAAVQRLNRLQSAPARSGFAFRSFRGSLLDVCPLWWNNTVARSVNPQDAVPTYHRK